MMMLFQPELGLSVLDLLGRSTDSVRWTPSSSAKSRKEGIGGGSAVASLMPKSVLFGGREDHYLGNEFSVRKSAYLSLMWWPGIYNG